MAEHLNIEPLNKEALLEEITRRVIQLDSQRQFDQDLHDTVNAYVEALDEITAVGKTDIEAIARQVINEYSHKGAGQQGLTLNLKHGLIAGVALLALLLVMAIFAGKYFGLKEGVTAGVPQADDSQINNRALIIRAKLAQVFVLMAPLKVAALEHYQTTLKFPSNYEELGYKSREFEDGRLVDKIEFTAEGGILLQLGKDFDPNSKLLLLSDALENNQVFKWRCKTTIPQHYLGPVSAAPCEFADNF